MNRAWIAAPLALSVLAGCHTTPDYHRPEATTIPVAYSGTTNGWKPATPLAHVPRGSWWEVFNDADLNRLETDAANANQQLKAAVAHFEQARAFVNVAKAGLLPHVGTSPSATRQRDSANRPENGHPAGRPYTFSNLTIPLDVGYELDLWGRVKRSVEVAVAAEQADAADVEAVRLAIQAEVATDYFTLRALDAERALLNTTVEVFQKSLELTRNRRAGGVATDLDVAQADTLLKTVQAQLPGVALQRAKLEHALAALTGQPATGFTVAERQQGAPPPVIPPELPSELLERRPDIASAERRMAGANASVGVAKTAFYPTVRINGLAGLQSISAGTLFSGPSRLWAVGPTLTMPIFDAGKNRAALRQAEAAYDETVARYRQSVLAAFAEVEDQLAAQNLLAAEYEAQIAALQSARKTEEIANNRFRAGLVTYLEVATAQGSALERERTAVQLRGQQLVAAVALVKSLGGGWQSERRD